MTACHRLRGGLLGCRVVVPACRRHPGRRNTGLRTAPTAYRGWKLPRLWSAFPLWRSSSDGIPSLVQRIYLIYKKCPAPRGHRAPGYILSEAVTSLLLIVFLFRFLKCAPLHVTNMHSVRISASGGDDDQRRAFPPPRRWWQPCVTPYFATRGRGDMRGAPNRPT